MLRFIFILLCVSFCSSCNNNEMILSGKLLPDIEFIKNINLKNEIGSDGDNQIKVLCNCGAECEPEDRCEWLLTEYNNLIYSDENEELKKLLNNSQTKIIEIADGGMYGCLTLYSELSKKFTRTDIEFLNLGNSIQIGEYKIEKKLSLPTLKQRKENSYRKCIDIF